MKRITLILSSFALIILLFSACQKDNTSVLSENIETMAAKDPQIVQLAIDETALMEMPLFVEGDLDKEFLLINDGIPKKLDDPNGPLTLTPDQQPVPVKPCLDSLNLAQWQLDSIHHALTMRHNCATFHLQQIKQINQQILQNANQHRQQLLNDYNNGLITQQQLHQALHQLRQQTRYAFRHHPAKVQHLQALRGCHRMFFFRLKHILTPAQWQQFIDCYL